MITHLNNSMIAAVCKSPAQFTIDSVKIPVPTTDEVLVQLEGCGVCGSNLPIWEGRPWFSYPLDSGAPGHEGWGRIVSTGLNVKTLKAGDRVAMLSNHAFAQFDKASEDSVVLLPSDLDGIPFPGEPLGCAINIFERSNITAENSVAIIGCGFIGLLLCQLISKTGAHLVAISRRNSALDQAKKCGAGIIIPFHDNYQVGKLISKNFPDGIDKVIEVTGFQGPLSLAGEIVKNRGQIIIAGYHQDGLRSVNIQQWNWKGIDVINAHERENARYVSGMKAAVCAVLEKRIDPVSLFTHEFCIENISDAFEMMRTQPEKFIKAVVKI
jgi:threonine dehydrogenase-like Zn-dependent dehydrogenase